MGVPRLLLTYNPLREDERLFLQWTRRVLYHKLSGVPFNRMESAGSILNRDLSLSGRTHGMSQGSLLHRPDIRSDIRSLLLDAKRALFLSGRCMHIPHAPRKEVSPLHSLVH